MFEKIKALFKVRTKIEEKEKILSLEDAKRLFEEKMREKENLSLDDCRRIQEEIKNRFKMLSDLLTNLGTLDIIEKRAIASKRVKDSFVKRALAVVKELEFNDFKNMEDVEKIVFQIESSLKRINISPREATHIHFFYSEEMKKINSEIEEITKSLDSLKDICSDLLKVRREIEKIFKNIEKEQHMIERDYSTSEQILNEIVELKKLKEGKRQKLHDLTELKNLLEKSNSLSNKRKEINQKIDSEFGAIRRLLKKFFYYEQYRLKKDESALINSYIMSPHEAFLTDENFLIKNFIVNSVQLATKGLIDVDLKLLQKADYIIDNFDELEKLKEESISILKDIQEIEREIEPWLIKQDENAKINGEITAIDEKIAEKEKRHFELLGDVEKLKKHIEEEKRSLAERISSTLKMNIGIK